MRSPRRWILGVTAAGLAVLAPVTARAFDWNGRLGLAYDRIETWSGPDHTLEPRLRLDGVLGARGYLVEPGVLDWSGNVGYENYRDSYGDTSREIDTLSYGLNLGLLQRPTARASIAGSAYRTRSDYSADAEAAHTTGTTTTDSYAVAAFSAPPGVPRVNAAFSYTDILNSGFDRAQTAETWRTLDLGTQMGQPGLNTSIDYELQSVSGTLAAMNFEAQRVTLLGNVDPAEGIHGSVRALYYLRAPDELGGSNPRFETTMVDGDVQWGTRQDEAMGVLRYRYDRSSATDPSLQLREVVSNGAFLTYERRFALDWRWIGDASASYAQRRMGEAVQSSAATQAAGLTLEYQRSATQASLGARVGAMELDGGSPELAYGASAQVLENWRSASHLLGLAYTVNYDSNLNAAGGWTVSQALWAELRSAAATLLRYGGRLQASGARAGGGVFGGNANRSVVASGSLGYGRADLLLELGSADAVSGALSNPISDGLFVPAGFNTHSRFASTTLGVATDEHLAFRLIAKYTIMSGPATPEQREALVNPALLYTVGLWTFTLEDRLTQGGVAAFDRRVNELYIRAVRVLGRR